ESVELNLQDFLGIGGRAAMQDSFQESSESSAAFRARCDSNMQNSARGSVPPGVTTPSQMALKTKKEPSAAAELFFWGPGIRGIQYLRRGKWLTLQAMRTHNGQERRSAP